MIRKYLPVFCFVDPTNKETINIRWLSSNTFIPISVRIIRTLWTPELAQDVSAFHNIDAEAELTALLSEQVAAEIDQQILRDLQDNQRFYQQNTFNIVLDRWDQTYFYKYV